jgi:predicted glycosyltransferase
MRILFDIVHPAQVHFFKHAIHALQDRGDLVMVTAREKDITVDLLKALEIEHTCISSKGSSMAGMGVELITRTWRLMGIARKFKPDVMVARVGHSIGIVGKLLRVPTVIYDDMEHARLQAAIGMTFATYICTGLGYFRDFGKRQVRFEGAPVLSYLSPEVFTPDPAPLHEAGVDPDQPLIFFRMVSWGATHDIGRAGTPLPELEKAIQRLSPYGRILISSEDPLPEALSEYANPVPVEHVHDLLAFATVCLIEGGTMAEEAAVLGTPSICKNTYDFGYLRALDETYGLVHRPDSMMQAVEIAEDILKRPESKADYAARREELLRDSEDVVAFMIGMVDRTAGSDP